MSFSQSANLKRPSSAGTLRRSSGACCTKFPPRAGQRKDLQPKAEDDGGLRVIFGRRPGLVYPPTRWTSPPEDKLPPELSLHRDYVYGYNGGCRKSLHWISDQEIVYPVAALVIVLDVESNTQRYFEGHNNDVTCLDWNEPRRLCISGQVDVKGAGGPFACVFAPDVGGMESICELQLPGSARQCTSVALSGDGQTAVVFAGDDNHTFYIWRGFARSDGRSLRQRRGPQGSEQVSRPAPQYSAASGRQPTYCAFMCPFSGGSGPVVFTTVGDKHFKLWNITLPEKGSSAEPLVTQKRGVFGKCPPPKNMTDVAWRADDGSAWMVGDNGSIYMVVNSTATREKRLMPVSAGVPLCCVAMLPDGRWLAASGDGTIYIGSAGPTPRVEEEIPFTQLRGDEVQAFASTATAKITTVSIRGDLAVFGTSNHAILLVNYVERRLVRVLQVAHHAEAWALDFHPSLAIMATASAVGGVRFWNVAERRPAVGKVLRLDCAVWSLAFEPVDGSLLALGCGSGVLEVCGFPSLQPDFREKLSKYSERIASLTFSDCGSWLAACCWDQIVYLLKIARDRRGRDVPQVKLHRSLQGNSSSPICAMFSADGHYVMSNSKDATILCWNTKDGDLQRTLSMFRDTKWQVPWTCMLGWAVLGIWGDDRYDGTDINSVCQSSAPDSGYIAIGDDYGTVKLFRFPCPYLNPPSKDYTGHASHVTAIRWSRTNVLCTMGGDDHSICQWSLQKPSRAAPVRHSMVHPWNDLEGSEAPADRFAFIGKPRAIPQQSHAWNDLEGADAPADRFAFIGKPRGAVPQQSPALARNSFDDQGGFLSPGAGRPSVRPGSAPPGRRAEGGPGRPSQQPTALGGSLRLEEAPIAGKPAKPLGRLALGNQSQGVGSALRWD